MSEKAKKERKEERASKGLDASLSADDERRMFRKFFFLSSLSFSPLIFSYQARLLFFLQKRRSSFPAFRSARRGLFLRFSLLNHEADCAAEQGASCCCCCSDVDVVDAAVVGRIGSDVAPSSLSERARLRCLRFR